jgi:hypothetical protein
MDDDAVDVVAGHSDDEVGFGDIITFYTAAFVSREVETAGGQGFDGVVGGWTTPPDGSSRVHARVHASLGEVMREESHRHRRPTGVA